MQRPDRLSGDEHPLREGARLRHSLAALCLLALAVGPSGPVACGGDLQSKLTEIQTLQDAGEWEASIEPLRQLLSDHSGHPEVNYRLGVAMMQTGRGSLAVWPLQKASQSEEYAVQAGLLLATTLLANEDHEEAVRAADRVLAIDPENTSALYARAHARIAAHDTEAALEDAKRIQEILPEDPRALTLQIGALLDLERVDEAEELHRRLMQVTEESGDADRAARACGAFAKFQLQVNRREKAGEIYRGCLQKYPDSMPVRSWLSEYYVEDGEVDAAAALWREAIEERPESPQLRVRLAKLLEDGGRAAQAGKVYEENVDLFDTLQAWRDLASYRRRTGDLDGAREAIENAIERAPGKVAALRYELADLLVLEGNLDGARTLAAELDEPAYRELLEGRIKLAEGDAKGALARFETGLRRWPNNANARYLAGLAALELGEIERARAEFREAVRADEAGTDASLRLAELYFAEGNYGSAATFAIRHIEARPFTGPEAHVIAARSTAAIGDHAEAELQLNDLLRHKQHAALAWSELVRLASDKLGPRKALELLPQSGLDIADPANRALLEQIVQNRVALGQGDAALEAVDAAASRSASPQLALLRARTLVALGRDDEASSAYQRLVNDPANAAAAHEGLGTLALGRRDAQVALQHYEKALAVEPGMAAAHYGAAHALLAQGRPKDAVSQLDATLAAEPTHAGASNDLAWLLAEGGGDLDRALSLAQRAARLKPGSNTLDTLGFVRLRRGQAEAAAKAFRRALDEFGGGASIRYRLGLALAADGKREEAASQFRKALESGGFPEEAEARRQLAELGRSSG